MDTPKDLMIEKRKIQETLSSIKPASSGGGGEVRSMVRHYSEAQFSKTRDK